MEGGFQHSHSADSWTKVLQYSNQSSGPEEPASTPACCTWGPSTALLYSRFSKPAPMFLDDSFRKWARIREFVPPFGIKGQGMLGTLTLPTCNFLSPRLSACTSGQGCTLRSVVLGSAPPPPNSAFTFSSSFPSCLFFLSLYWSVYSVPTRL